MKVGIIGGGQLAQMLALQANPMGIEVRCLCTNHDVSVKNICQIDINRGKHSINNFVDNIDILTFESENIDCESLENFAQKINIWPSLRALKIAQDRILEKEFFHDLDIKTAKYFEVNSHQELEGALEAINGPSILKTCRFGYDGKGQINLGKNFCLKEAKELVSHHRAILEEKIPFDFEVSQIACRGLNGEIVFYPLVKNLHHNGILRVSRVLNENHPLNNKAKNYVERVLNKLDYIGTLCLEFFVKNDSLIANEMAPRVHNSGHWTIDGAVTSQFENHLRAITGLHLGEAKALSPCAMINIIGKNFSPNDILKINGTKITNYHKTERPNRKLGHITVLARSEEELEARLALIKIF